MNTNNDFSTNPLELIQIISRLWRWPIGLLGLFFIEMYIVLFADIISLSQLFKVILLLLLFINTSLIWAISNKLAFHRTKYWTLLWLSIIEGITSLFPTIIYNNLIINTRFNLPYMQLWGTILIALILFSIYYVIDFKFTHKNGLIIVFLISNTSKFETKIRSTLEEARYKIEKEDPNINIIIPPFGIANNIKKCELFIKNLFCQADAVVYTRVIDSNDEFGYKFTDFTSRMNSRHMSKKTGDINHNQILSEASKCKDWNSFNKEGNSITKKEIMANDLFQLLLIYVGCIYLYKKMYSEAIPIADKLFKHSRGEENRLKQLTNELVSYAYLTAERWEEQENQDYNKALQNLQECKKRLPYITTTLRYKLAMARVKLLLGDIKSSKKYTKSVKPSNSAQKSAFGEVKNPHIYDWYIHINLAFYAIYERKPIEIISNYKKLFKSPFPNKEEVAFAINFLQNQYKDTYDDQYRMFLLHGIAFLHLYLDKKKALSYIEEAKSYKELQGYNQLLRLRNIITEYNDNLHMRE